MDSKPSGLSKSPLVLSGEAEANLLGMLRSMEAENQMLALNMLEGIAVPREAITDLFALSLFSRNHWLRDQARNLFRQHAPRGFVLALQDELNFRKFTPHRHMEWFMRVRRRHVIDSPVLAHYMYRWEMITLPAYMKYGIANARTFFAPFIKGDKLDLSFRGMDEVPTELQELSHLRSVDLSGNVLTRLGRIVARLPQLEFLKASDNQLERLNPTLGRMRQLRHLDLSSNYLQRLPAGISRLHQLRHLDLNRNLLEELPPFTTELSRLQDLNLGFNKLQHLPSQLGRWRKIRRLILSGNGGLKELPDSIGELSSLEELHLNGTSIRELPKELAKLKKLHHLNLRRLHLEDAQVLEQLPSLELLDLRGTELKNWPQVLGKGQSLRVLLSGDTEQLVSDQLKQTAGWELEQVVIHWQGTGDLSLAPLKQLTPGRPIEIVKE